MLCIHYKLKQKYKNTFGWKKISHDNRVENHSQLVAPFLEKNFQLNWLSADLEWYTFMGQWQFNPAGIKLFKINERNPRTKQQICPKLTMQITVRRQWSCSDVFFNNFEHISHLAKVSLVNFEQVNAGWQPILSLMLYFDTLKLAENLMNVAIPCNLMK